jgi:hypothetical protein
MMAFVRTSLPAALLTVLSLGAASGVCAAPLDTEVREFTIEIEGKASGKYTMTLTTQNDGVESVKTEANLSFKHFWGTYTYAFGAVEHWKNGRLLQLTSTCNDDGKKYEVSVTQQNDALMVKVNGHPPRKCPGDAWTTTYWTLADPRRSPNNPVPLLDADTGKEYPVGHRTYVGKEQLLIGGKDQTCYHFRVTGGPTTPCDLWFDGQYRLVRQELVDQGRHVVFVLTALKR